MREGRLLFVCFKMCAFSEGEREREVQACGRVFACARVRVRVCVCVHVCVVRRERRDELMFSATLKVTPHPGHLSANSDLNESLKLDKRHVRLKANMITYGGVLNAFLNMDGWMSESIVESGSDPV